jgi:hypothetical protein
MVVRTVRMPKVDFLSQSSRRRSTLARDRPLPS